MPSRLGNKTLRLPKELRDELSKPRGTLIKGKEHEAATKAAEFVKKSRPPKLITVGDIVTRSMIWAGVKPDLSIIDGKTLRGPEQKVEYDTEKKYTLVNPAELITATAWKVISKALKESKRTLIVVEGEEDLLGIPVTLLAPRGSLMLYGQPNEGVVIVTVNDEIKEFANSVLSRMEEETT